MWRDRRFHSKRLPGWAGNVQLTLSAFSKWCNIITWGNVLSSKWDKFIFCRAAFVPSGGEAIKLAGSVGSPARHMWHERGARRKKAWPPPKSLPLPSVRPRPRKAGGHAAAEQIPSNLSVLVLGLRWEGCSPAPSPPVPHVGPLYPCQHTARRTACRRGWGRGGLGGCWSCRDLGASVDRSCVLSAGHRFAREKVSERRGAGTGPVSPPGVQHQYNLYFLNLSQLSCCWSRCAFPRPRFGA